MNKITCNKNNQYDVNEIINGLWLGNVESAYDHSFHKKYNIKYIISIYDKFNYSKKNKNVKYLFIPIKDKHVINLDITSILNDVSDYIHKILSNGHNILVHCKNGHHRSGSIIGAYLIKFKGSNYNNAITHINDIRPCAVRRQTHMMDGLYDFYLQRNNIKYNNKQCYHDGKKYKCHHN